jgi:pimeloyl-ACP methyl ester carboxylesterase
VPVVLLSRFQGTIDDWDSEVLSRLTARRRVIAFDNAGIGLSEGTVQSSITEMADTVLGFVDALGLVGGR